MTLYILYNKIMRRNINKQPYEMFELTPWGSQQKSQTVQLQSQELPRTNKPNPIRHRKRLEKKQTERQHSTIKIIDYKLPPVSRKKALTIDIIDQINIFKELNQGRLIRNISNHKLSHNSYSTIIDNEKKISKLKLSGKKYKPISLERSQKNQGMYRKNQSHYHFIAANTLFEEKNKEDVLKRVLGQLRGKIIC